MKTSYKREKQLFRKAGIYLFLLAGCLFIGTESKAQLNPLGGTYFQNQYLSNPALAGLDSGLNLSLGYRQQWSSIPGSPKTQSLTGDYAMTDKVGLGLNILNDEAGLLKRTKIVGTYAYHLPLNGEDQKLNFGISLGFMNERVGYEDLKGDASDQNVAQFNKRETFIDGDFGVAYTSNKLTVQGAIPNLKSFFSMDDNSNTVDRSTFFTSLSYKFYFPESLDGMGIEPKVCFRGVKGYDNMADIGTNLTFANEAVSLMAMYHTSQSATFGMGVRYKRSISVLGIYTTNTSALSGYTNGNFELGMKVNLF